jgi:hypothetical protein
MKKEFESKHKLPFMSAEYDQPLQDGYNWHRFKVGTCEGLFAFRGNAFYILAIENTVKGNGHFGDVLEWFEHGCKENQCSLVFLEVWNKKLLQHLTEKRGFKQTGVDARKSFEEKNPN